MAAGLFLALFVIKEYKTYHLNLVTLSFSCNPFSFLETL